MKNPKKLTYNERKIIKSWGLNPENWRREKVTNGYLYLRNYLTNEPRECPARVKGERL